MIINLINKNISVLAHASTNAVVGVLNILMILVAYAVFGGEEYSILFLLISLIFIGEVVSDFGMRLGIVGDLNYPANINVLISAFTIKTIVSIIFFTIVYSLYGDYGLVNLLLMLFISFTQPSTDPYIWKMRVNSELKKESKYILVSKLTQAIIVFIFLPFNNHTEFYLFIWLGLNLARLFMEAVNDSENQNYISKSTNIASIFVRSAPFGISLLLLVLNSRIGVLLLEITNNKESIGTYGLIYSVISGTSLLFNSFAISKFKFLIEKGNALEFSTIYIHSKKIILYITLIYFGLITLVLTGRLVINLLYPVSDDLTSALIFLLLATGAYSINNYFKYLFAAIGSKIDVYFVSIGVIVQVIMFLELLEFWDAILVCSLSLFLSEITMLGFKLYFLYKLKDK